MKRSLVLILAALMLLALAACGGRSAAPAPTPEPAAAPAPTPAAVPSGGPSYAVSGGATAEPSASQEPAADEPAPATATPGPITVTVLTPKPDPTPLPLVPGTYTGSDGSVLTVKADGTCTYETTLTGTVNGKQMEGRVTFHGTVEAGEFSFTKVTYFGVDLTEMAKSAGYTSAVYWETAAGVIYADALK